MTSARMAIGDNGFKINCNTILAQCNWLPIQYMINISQCNLLHKNMVNKNPVKIFKTFIFPNRKVKDIRINIQSKSKLSKTSILFNGIQSYNDLPTHFKELPANKFKFQIQFFLQNCEQLNTNDIWYCL